MHYGNLSLQVTKTLNNVVQLLLWFITLLAAINEQFSMQLKYQTLKR